MDSTLYPGMTLMDLTCVMVFEIQRIEALGDKATPEERCKCQDLHKNLGEFLQHVDQQIKDEYDSDFGGEASRDAQPPSAHEGKEG
jgi:hypothetical protein